MNKKLFLALPLLAMLLVGCATNSGGKTEDNSSDESTTSQSSQTSDGSSNQDSSSGGETSEQSSETSEQSSESSEESSESSSEETPTGVAYSIKVGETSYALVKQEMDLLDNQTGQYQCTIDSVTKNAAVAFYGDNALISENIGSDAENEDNKNLVQDGVIHNDATNVSVYFKTWNDGGYSFWLTGYVADEVIPEESIYSIKVGETSYPLAEDKGATLLDTQTGQFTATITSVTAGEAVAFYAGEDLISEKIGSDKEDAENKNLVQGDKIHNDATNVSVYFKTWSDGGYSYWLTGYVAGEEQIEEPYGPEGSEHVSWYVVGKGSFVTSDWSTDGGVQLYSNPLDGNAKGCILNMHFEDGDLIKVTNGTDWYGYDKVDQFDNERNAGVSCFAGVADGYSGQNIKCTTTGYYDMYVQSSGTIWIEYHE